jgi:nucleoside-diphosphate-sugar epimerase
VGTGNDVHATGRALQRLAGLDVSTHVAPIEEPEAFARLTRQLRPDIVFHLAARTERDRKVQLLLPMLRDNALPVAALCEALADRPDTRLVVLCSGEDYGNAPGPWHEGQRESPVSPYGLSKVVAAEIVMSAHATFGLNSAAARAPVVYGPGQRPGQFIPSLIAACLAHEAFPMTLGEQLRDFLYIDDLIEGLIAMCSPPAAGKVVHLASGRSSRIADVARQVQALVGGGELQIGAMPYRLHEVMEQVMSPSAAELLLGWKARVDLEEGLRRTIDAARAEAAAR